MTTLASVQRTDARAQGRQLDHHRAVQGRDSDAWTRTMAMQMRGCGQIPQRCVCADLEEGSRSLMDDLRVLECQPYCNSD